jgi:hypothetical protein
VADVEAFRTFALDTPFTARTLHAKLEKQKDDLSAQVADGWAKDWADYNRRVGVIEGLEIAMSICVDVEKQERQ